MRKILYLLALLLIIAACKKEEITETPLAPKKYQITGKVEKGPFVKGSKITIQELNEELLPTGKNFTTSIVDDEGSFSLGNIELTSPYVELIADGFFYNERTGNLSNSQITLYSLADLRESTTTNVNLVTHIIKDRIANLVKTEKIEFKEAQLKAQNEFLSIFGLQKHSDKNFNNISISDGTYQASCQVMISSILLDNKSEAQFTEFITSLSSTFKSNGSIPSSIKEELWKTSINLPFKTITDQLTDRYEQLKREIKLLDLRHFVDWDKDGIAGNELGDINAERVLEFEIDTLYVPKTGGEFRVKINANIPFSENRPFDSPVDIGIYDPIKAIYTSIEILNKKINNNEIILEIKASNGPFMDNSSITVYSLDGETKATLVIEQEGDISKFSNKEMQLLSQFLGSSAAAFDFNFTAEALYTQSANMPQNDYFKWNWDPFYINTVTSSFGTLSTMYDKNYSSIERINQWRNAGFPDILNTPLEVLQTIHYYQLIILWGKIFYHKELNDFYPAQLNEIESFDKLAIILKEANGQLLNEKYNFFPISNDVSDTFLAKVLMHQKKHAEAATLLRKIINSGRYSMENDRAAALQHNSRELIFGLPLIENSSYKKIYPERTIIPILRYSETLLLAAECAIHTGNTNEATKLIKQVTKKDKNTAQIEDLAVVWKEYLSGEFSYFDFLKRNNLAEKILGIESYKKLLPIPQNEINKNPNVTQNPGY